MSTATPVWKIRSWFVSIVVLLGLAGVALAGLIGLEFGRMRDARAAQRNAHDSAIALKDLRFHVVQIQQYLTDVGATHDSGGFDEAAAHLASARATAARLGELDPERAPAFARIAAEIANLHATGVEMARAYVLGGLEAGNAIMQRAGSGVDPLSARLSSQIDALGTTYDTAVGTADARLAEAAARASRQITLFAVGLLVAVTGMMYGLYKRVLPPLARVSRVLARMNAGDADLRNFCISR